MRMNEKTRKKDLSLIKVKNLTISRREELISNRISRDFSKRNENERLKGSTLSSINSMRIQIKRTWSISEMINSLSKDQSQQSLIHSLRRNRLKDHKHQNQSLQHLSNSDLQLLKSSQLKYPQSQRNQLNAILWVDTNNSLIPGDKINSSLQTKGWKKAEN